MAPQISLLLDANKRIALLEKVAEAAEQEYQEQQGYGYPAKSTCDRLHDALRAAGYLEEGK